MRMMMLRNNAPACRRPFHLFVLIALFLLALPAWARLDIRVGMQLEPPTLDPTQTAAAAAGEITYCNLFEGLTVIDGDGQLTPRLAKTWSVSDDGLTYTFSLRKDVRFHDGKRFNARSAAFSIKRIVSADSKNPQRKWFEKIRSVEATSEHVLQIHLNHPDSLLTFALALPAAVMVHPDSVAGNATHPIGTGPYRLAEWLPGQKLKLKRNADYWGEKPYLEQAEFYFMQTTAGTENMLAEGMVDGLVSVTRVTNRFGGRPDYKMSNRQLESKMLLAINNGRPPFDDIRVRRALSHAINKNELRTMYGAQFNPDLIGSHFPPSHPAYVDLVDRYPYDPKRARELLREAGVDKGTPVKLTVPPTDYGRYGGLMLAEDLEAIGFKVELDPVDWKTWMQSVFTDKDYALTLIIHVEPMDLNIYARDNYYFNYANDAFKAIWKQVLDARTDKELNHWLGEAQKQIAEDAVNVFLFIRPERNLMHKDLQGLWENSSIPSFVLEDIHWTH
ncbi:MAG: ABC transporter substrate-binding protein [Oceanospirillaceae bacterium]|nr:ABC transporter substrate-binding protein [Oceanospirillaceae bacterium]